MSRAPGYQAAVRDYRRGDFAGALGRVERLLLAASPSLNPAERAFLQRQRALCQRALSSSLVGTGPTPPGVRVSAANATAVSLARRTAAPAATPSAAAASDCGPRALLLACRALDAPTSLAELTRAASTTKEGTTLAGLQKAAESAGLKATGVQMDRDALAHLSRPAVAWVDGGHYVAVLGVNHGVSGDTATIHDPNKERKENVPLSDLLGRSGGVLLTLSPAPRR